ncbi:MAG TPA: tripartite tricarboxylate transporter substrate binding protein [Burkholderiales bacterium]|nr:tripartite tricarboxylate transporter substrate binding protein [Burkholderiales bacterium]
MTDGYSSREHRRALARRVACAALVLCCAAAGAASAQTYPARPIRILLPFGPGGVTDITARLLAQRLTDSLKQQVIIDNRPGAGGIVATELARKAEPDGHTIMWLTTGHALAVAMFKSLPYDPVKDFRPVSTVGFFALALVVTGESPVKSVPALIAAVKVNPARFNFAITNIGSSHHLSSELFKSMTGLPAQIVPFKTTPALVSALRSGEAQAAFEFISPVLPHLKSGALRALAVTSARRFAGLPEIPTVAEAGLPGFEVSAWNGTAVPAGTPRRVIDRLNREVNAALAIPEVKARLQELGIEARPSTPEGLRDLLAAEIAKWNGVVDKAKIQRQ